MKTLTIEIPKNMTLKEVKEILAKNGISVKKAGRGKEPEREIKTSKEEDLFFSTIERIRERKPKISLEEITKTVESERQKMYDEKHR